MSARKIFALVLIAFSIHVLAAMRMASPTKEMPTAVFTHGEAAQDTLDKDSAQRRKPRYSMRRTGATEQKDLRKKTADLRDPDNLKTEVTYDEKDNTYSVGTTLDRLNFSVSYFSRTNALTTLIPLTFS